LAPWGDSDSTPLQITVQDRQELSPFGIAVLRKHWDVARAIVEISFAQYHVPEEEKPKTYRIGEDDEEDASDSNDVTVFAEIIDDRFTIDNIGEVASQVKSSISPLTFVSRALPIIQYIQCVSPGQQYTCGVDDRQIYDGELGEFLSLQSWAIVTNDKTLFAFMLDLDVEWSDRLAKNLDGSSGIPSFAQYDFDLAIEHGRVELLAEMIKHGGELISANRLVFFYLTQTTRCRHAAVLAREEVRSQISREAEVLPGPERKFRCDYESLCFANFVAGAW
jgi:hypothetical protein